MAAVASPGLMCLLRYKPFQNVLILYGREYSIRYSTHLSDCMIMKSRESCLARGARGETGNADYSSDECPTVLFRGGLPALCVYAARSGGSWLASELQ